MRRTIPLGYEIRDGKAVIHEGVGKMVRYAFEAYCKGDSQFTIAKVFQEAGYKNGNGRVSWSQSTIGKLLCNRVYLEDDFYPQLITQEIFDKAAEVRNEKAVHQKRYRNDDYEYREPRFAFSAKLFCEICGCTFYRFQVKMKDEGYLAVWKCRSFKEHNEKGLTRTNMYESEIEEIFIGVLHELAKDLRALFYKPVVQQMISSDIKELDKDISELLSTTKSALENKYHINELIAKRAYLQYERSVVDDFDYQTGKIKRMLADKDLMDKTFDAEFFRGVIEKVTLKKDGLLCFRFLNGFEISKKYERKVGVKNGSKEC